ncbi:hypothetical protein G6F57_001284 [Rhizopus arrhizus]|uniref:Early meiotic induction protein 1 n=1 Tax=Rhizopus oryzae TaxID=64495 RepID=A0A9P7BWM3_RHIOR|nr:hypothetical protein G6F23_010434 [Rhizopus arrhizus]KAG1422325.1 hypothetical protein G6F58_003363 [Rhizopus delemar]KAG0769571.1 hypothetical protein G6F24_000962 [Rhizopus arrhizus]KAG0784595.1 hypothetical protein G6F22_008256 [Rhizopus arrhizus]KAG0796383.1 hypothetical protein G6F21_001357 [Rhizopus arrhizus]
MSTLSQEDKDTNEFFAEVEKDKKAHYEKCSAIDAFDAVFNCYRVKEQAKHYYRYGTKKDCEAKWDYFSVCFSTKLKSAEKADAILKAHREATEEKKTGGPSSEDIWERRI